MYTALLVDDERRARMVLMKLGQWENINVHKVYEASSMAQALTEIEEHRPDIVITDMNMPEQDGVMLLQRISALGLEPFVLVVSGYTDFEYTHQAILSKVQNYLLKPVDPSELNRNLLEIYNQLESRRAETGEDISETEINPSTMDSIRAFVESHYAQSITLEMLSGQFYISKEHISRSFKKRYGTRLFDHINECRLGHVCDMLRGTSLSVDEISELCGFSCGNYLRRVFKKQYGLTPSEFRSRR